MLLRAVKLQVLESEEKGALPMKHPCAARVRVYVVLVAQGQSFPNWGSEFRIMLNGNVEVVAVLVASLREPSGRD
jgi:hypothetical protein